MIFENKKAVGIELERFGRKEVIRTNKEIILSAGNHLSIFYLCSAAALYLGFWVDFGISHQ